MKSNTNYRAFDYSTNIVVPTKVSNYNQYAPYQTIKQFSQVKSSKKIQPSSANQTISHSNPNYSPHVNLHLKILDRNKRNQKILSRNDRADLYLEGGKVLEFKKANVHAMISAMNRMSANSQKHPSAKNFFHEPIVPRMIKSKKNSEIAASINCNNYQKNNQGWICQSAKKECREKYSFIGNNTSVKYQEDEPIMIKVLAQQARKQSRQQSRKSLINFMSTQSQESAKDPKTKHKDSFQCRKYNSMRSQLKTYAKTDSKNNRKKKQSQEKIVVESKIKRPLFYLEPKQISHIKAESFIVTQYPSGQIIMGNYFRKVAQIASLTKIMTFYTVFQIAQKYQRDVYSQTIQIDEEAQSMTGTSAQIFVGDIYTVEQLLYGMMLPSGNDAATALAKWAGKLIQQNQKNEKSPTQKNMTPLKIFINQMNSLAKSLNLKNSKFFNPHGLPNSLSGSNPEQMAMLISQCLKINLFREIVQTKQYKCWVDHNGVQHQVVWQNTNKLLRRSNFIGVKTGVTITAGPCLATCYQSGSKIFIIVLLRTTKLSRRFKQTRQILALALSKLSQKEYKNQIREILKHDIDLDSDNSEDEHEFCYQRSDPKEMAKRNKILALQM